MENIKVKVGRKEYEPQEGDYILWNGACYQFCAGDGRTLVWQKWNQYSAVTLPNSAVKKLPLHTLLKDVVSVNGKQVTKWFF